MPRWRKKRAMQLQDFPKCLAERLFSSEPHRGFGAWATVGEHRNQAKEGATCRRAGRQQTHKRLSLGRLLPQVPAPLNVHGLLRRGGCEDESPSPSEQMPHMCGRSLSRSKSQTIRGKCCAERAMRCPRSQWSGGVTSVESPRDRQQVIQFAAEYYSGDPP